MKKIFKAIYIVALFSLLKVVQSCALFGGCECSDEVHYFSISSIEISNIDNSGLYPVASNANEMYASAVAFSVNITDTTFSEYYSYGQNSRMGFGFNAAYAWSCDCPIYFQPNESIVSVKIFTHFDINDTIPAGTNVAEYFLAQDVYGYNSDLYIELNDAISKFNRSPLNEPSIRFNIFFGVPVELPEAEFTLEISLDNGDILSVNTNLISIFQPID